MAGGGSPLRSQVILLGVLDQVRVVDSLPQADEQIEDVRIIVEHLCAKWFNASFSPPHPHAYIYLNTIARSHSGAHTRS